MSVKMSVNQGEGISMRKRNLSRRDFLRLSSITATGAVLSACFSDQDDAPAGEPVEIRFATDWVDGARGATMDAALDMFADLNPDIRVSLEPIEGDYFDHLQSQISGGTVADVILFEGVLGAEFIAQGLIADLSETLDTLNIDQTQWRPGAVDIFKQGGKVYAIPFQLTPALWFYNQTLFEERGVDLPDGSWDWDRTLAAAKQLTDAPNTYGIDARVDMFHQYGALGLANSDHHWVTEDFTETLVGEENFAASIRWFISLVQEHGVSPQPEEIDDPFEAGKVGMTTGNAGSIGHFNRAIGDRFEWDVMPTPKGPASGRGGGMWNDQPHVVTGNAVERKALSEATHLVIFLAGNEVQRIIAQDRGATPTPKAIQESDAYLSAPPNSMQTVLDELVQMQGPRFFPGFLAWFRALNHEFELGLSGERGVDETIDAMVNEGNKILAEIPGR